MGQRLERNPRRDLAEIAKAAHQAGLYTNLITSAVGLTLKTLDALVESGLDHVQISIQDSETASADRIAGYDGAFARKRALATEVVRRKLPLTVNAVVHRANIDRIVEMVEQAIALGAGRIEIAHVQYYGWALKNRASLMPIREQVECAVGHVEELRARYRRRGSRLLRAVSQTLPRRLGPALAQRHTLGQGAPLPRRGVDPRTRVLVRDGAFPRRHLAILACIPGFSRDELDAGALRQLPSARPGFSRMPMPGLRANRRRTRNRSGMPFVAQPCPRSAARSRAG